MKEEKEEARLYKYLHDRLTRLERARDADTTPLLFRTLNERAGVSDTVEAGHVLDVEPFTWPDPAEANDHENTGLWNHSRYPDEETS